MHLRGENPDSPASGQPLLVCTQSKRLWTDQALLRLTQEREPPRLVQFSRNITGPLPDEARLGALLRLIPAGAPAEAPAGEVLGCAESGWQLSVARSSPYMYNT